MNRLIILGILAIGVALTVAVIGCDSERIVESTEYVHDIQYVTDTLTQIDTVISHDTVLQIDTVIDVNNIYDTTYIYDTVTTVQNHYDTVIIVDTVIQVNQVHDTMLVYVYDTVVTVEQHYDTIFVTDTVVQVQYSPNKDLAFAALQFYCDPLVIQIVNSELGYTDGWIFYLSVNQVDLTSRSTGVYDIYGYVNYWTPDWSGYYPLEYYWRMSYVSGDPADPNNWQMTEPPAGASDHKGGVRLMADTEARPARR